MKIAIVEDDINMRKALEIAFSDLPEFEVKTFKNAKDALKNLDNSFELVVTDINMPGMDGIELIKELGGRYEVIVITGNATLSKAIDSLRMGVKDFLTKPFEMDTLITAIKRSQKAIRFDQKHTPQERAAVDGNTPFTFVSPSLERPLTMAKKAAQTDAAIILLGQSGVGKEVFANFIHNNSKRANKPFIPINMAAIPETLIESELFGFEKGAFTDAQTAKPGKFEEATGGTLFLDEIGEMPYHLQAKLLRALQEQEITRLGSTKPIKVDIRLISATNQNIDAAITEGRFREDLYYRINTVPVTIPPLKERREEILPIATAVLEEVCCKYGFEAKYFSKEAEALLNTYNWPGNIRELKSVCERAAILSENTEISKSDLFIEERETKKNINIMEKELLGEILNEAGQDIDEAARMFGTTVVELEKKMKKYNL
jgi:DNA-binding NtrC family response regulator